MFGPTIKTLGFMFVATQGYAQTVDMELFVGTLAPTCSFSNPVTGQMLYNEANNSFDPTPFKSSVDLTARGMSHYIIEGSFDVDNQVGVVQGVDWGVPSTTLTGLQGVASTGFANYSSTNWDLAGLQMFPTQDDLSTTIEVMPLEIQMNSNFIVSNGAAYTTNFVITCVQ